MAYSTLQESVDAFLVPGLGYIGYTRGGLFRTRTFVLADPIAPQDRHGELLDLFLAEHPDAVFVQTGEATARLLRDRDFWVNEFGTETEIDIQSFKMSWGKHRNIQRMYNIPKR